MGVQNHGVYNTSEVVRRCQRCVLPETCPNIEFDENGVCNVCRDFDRRWGSFKRQEFLNSEKIELERIFNSFRKKGKSYDCLVPISGGLDSSYVLYVCKKIYGLRVFAFNFDNGFQSELTKQNLQNVVKELNVDFVSYKPSWKLARRLYGLFFRKTGYFCTPCIAGIRSMSYKFAKDLGIPLIVRGASERVEVQFPKGGSPNPPRSTSYFKEVIRGEISCEEAADYLYAPNILEKGLSRISMRFSVGRQIRTIALNDYLQWDRRQILKILESELRWRHAEKYEHADCIMDPVRIYLRQKKLGFSAAANYSMLVRNGQIDRKRALKMTLREEASASKEPPIMERWLESLNLSREDLDVFERRSYLPYSSIRASLLRALEHGTETIIARLT